MYGQGEDEGRPRTPLPASPLLAWRRAVARGVRYRRGLRRRRRRCLVSQLRANGGANGRSIGKISESFFETDHPTTLVINRNK